MISRDPEMSGWVHANSKVSSHNWSEMIYSAIHQTDGTCDYGKKQRFRSVTQGYRSCGPAGVCRCARENVSEKVSAAKKNHSSDHKHAINQKRIVTNLQKYGITNTGQTAHARQRHREYFDKLPRQPKLIPMSRYEKLNRKFQERARVRFLTPESQYRGVIDQRYYDFQCLVCDKSFADYIDNGHLPVCRDCNPSRPSYVSQQETDLRNFVSSISPHPVHQSNKSLINPYELDIVIPALDIAIEYCGLYWHSEAVRLDPGYHIKKMSRCNEKNIRLITVFEDEWTQKSHIVKQRLKNILGVDHKIYARNCQIAEIDRDTANSFLEEYHIQGSAIAAVNLGCFLRTELVAVMTFGKPRYDKNFQYELIRYCSKGTVVGGAGRLFAQFQRAHSPRSVISYCDMRWGTGHMYSALGFHRVEQVLSPGYAYTDFVNRYHRSNFTKSRLILGGADKNLTEREIMVSKKMFRIWDCGQSKWVWTAASVTPHTQQHSVGC